MQIRSLGGLTVVVLLCLTWVWHRAPTQAVLEEFYPQNLPVDPIVSPLMMGYSAEQNAVGELSNMANPLQAVYPAAQYRYLSRFNGARFPSLARSGGNVEGAAPSDIEREDTTPSQHEVLEWLPVSSLAEPRLAANNADTSRAVQDNRVDMSNALKKSKDPSLANELEIDDEKAKAVQSALGVTPSLLAQLQHLRNTMVKESRIARLQTREGKEEEEVAKERLSSDRQAITGDEALRRRNVKYLHATQNFAALAAKEISDAIRKDRSSAATTRDADVVLQRSHEAYVKARLEDNAAALAAAEHSVASELAAVRRAKRLVRQAAKEREDAKENAFVAQAVDRVRRSNEAKAQEPQLQTIVQEEKNDETDIINSRKYIAKHRAMEAKAKQFLVRAAREVNEAKAAAALKASAEQGLQDLRTAEADQGRLGKYEARWRRDVGAARQNAAAGAHWDQVAAEAATSAGAS